MKPWVRDTLTIWAQYGLLSLCCIPATIPGLYLRSKGFDDRTALTTSLLFTFGLHWSILAVYRARKRRRPSPIQLQAERAAIDAQTLREQEDHLRKTGRLGPNQFLDSDGQTRLRDPRFGPAGDPGVRCGNCGYPFEKDESCLRCGLVGTFPPRGSFKIQQVAGVVSVEHEQSSECAIPGPHSWSNCEFWKKRFGLGSPSALMSHQPRGLLG